MPARSAVLVSLACLGACAGTPPIESWRAFELSVDDGKATTGRVRIGKVGGRWALMWQMETSAGVLDAGAEAVVDAVGT